MKIQFFLYPEYDQDLLPKFNHFSLCSALYREKSPLIIFCGNINQKAKLLKIENFIKMSYSDKTVLLR